MAIEQNSKLIHDYLDENNWKYRYIPEKELYFGNVGMRGVISTVEFLICMSDTHALFCFFRFVRHSLFRISFLRR